MNELMRKDTEDSYELKELQNVILNIAAYVDKLCVEHDINYRLMGGSALWSKTAWWIYSLGR